MLSWQYLLGTNSIRILLLLQGCTVIGFAGTDAKVAYLKELGYDEAINYKKITNLDETIQKAAPKGVDVYYDNVGRSDVFFFYQLHWAITEKLCTPT